MNIFPCHEQGVWQCEWHDCSSNFTLQTPEISVIIRDDQQPDAANAIEFADPNAKFVAVSQTNSLSAVATSDTPVPVSTTSSTSPTSSTSTLAASVSSVSTDPPPPSTPTPAPNSTLSVGAKAGVAVGAVFGAVAVGTLLYFLLVRRRRPRHENVPRTTSLGVRGGDTGHRCGHCGSAKSELTGQPARTEMDAAGVTPELVARGLRWEMEAGVGRGG